MAALHVGGRRRNVDRGAYPGRVQALVNQHLGRFRGNPSYAYYAFANFEYGRRGSATCNSTNGAASCAFSMTSPSAIWM
jgi:hypothetical protein